MGGASDAELDFATGEFVDNVLCIAQGSGQPVEFDHDQGVPVPAGVQCFPESGSCQVGPGQALVDECLLRRHTKSDQGTFLGGEVLVVGGYAGVSDEESGHGVECTG